MNLRTVTVEIRENLYGLRSARCLAEECEAYGNLSEAERHRTRARKYALSVRRIIKNRGDYGPMAYPLARQELQS